MISKLKLKEYSSYKQQKYCEMDQVFVVEGVKMCEEALRSKFPIRSICATNRWLEAHDGDLPVGVPFYEVTDSELERLSGQKQPNEVWMLLYRPRTNELRASMIDSLTLALDHIQDPGNLGTIIRIADWFGIRNIVCSSNTVSCWNPKVVQSTMGGIFRTNFTYTNLGEWMGKAKSAGIPIYGAMLDGEDLYGKELMMKGILVIGNESKGISPEVAQFVNERLLIPNYGGTCESLNAAVATGIICSEIFRRK